MDCYVQIDHATLDFENLYLYVFNLTHKKLPLKIRLLTGFRMHDICINEQKIVKLVAVKKNRLTFDRNLIFLLL